MHKIVVKVRKENVQTWRKMEQKKALDNIKWSNYLYS